MPLALFGPKFAIFDLFMTLDRKPVSVGWRPAAAAAAALLSPELCDR
jgi:hypothetical protein